MPEDFLLEHATPQPTLVMRFRTPAEELPKRFAECYSAIASRLEHCGEPPAGPPFAIYHNMAMNDLDVEAGFPVARALNGDERVLPSSLPGGQVATIVHVGPYERIGATYDGLLRSLDQAGWRAGGAFWESYLNSPKDTAPSELRTRISVPVIAKS